MANIQKVISGMMLGIAFPLLLQAQEFKVQPKPLRVGQSFVRGTEISMNIRTVLKYAGSLLDELDQDHMQTMKKVETILATNGSEITSMKIFYEQLTQSVKVVSKNNGEVPEKPDKFNRLQGKTYVVKTSGDTVSVTDANGRTPSSDEVEAVKKDYSTLGQAHPLVTFLQDKQVVSGETIRVPQWVVRDFLHDQNIKVEHFTVTLKSFAGKRAVFATALKVSGAADRNTSLKMNLTGEAIIDVQNGLLSSFSLEGPTRVTGLDQIGNRMVMVDGTGIMTIKETIHQK